SAVRCSDVADRALAVARAALSHVGLDWRIDDLRPEFRRRNCADRPGFQHSRHRRRPGAPGICAGLICGDRSDRSISAATGADEAHRARADLGLDSGTNCTRHFNPVLGCTVGPSAISGDLCFQKAEDKRPGTAGGIATELIYKDILRRQWSWSIY